MKRIVIKLIVILSFVIYFGDILTRAEGTKEFRPVTGDLGVLQINDGGRPFALTTNTDSLHRLYIHVSSTTETIYLGFQHIGTGTGTFRIKNRHGAIEFAQTNIPTRDSGYISNYTQAINGPKINGSPSAGYLPFKFKPSTTGDYYIEFTTDLSSSYHFDLFDITVVNASNTPIKGRLWSYAWDLNTCAAANPYNGSFYIYTKDGFITCANMHGFAPWGFVISANSTGTGNLIGGNNENRQSVFGNSTRPEYRVFLNLPDTNTYHVGKIPRIVDSLKIVNTPIVGDTVVFAIRITKPGTIDILLDLNGISGYQSGTEDVILVKNLDSGLNYIYWDGKNGLGNYVQGSTSIKLTSSFTSGITHMPIYDPENNTNGFIVNRLYPVSGQAQLYWDDSPLGGTVNVDGHITDGHAWRNDFGNNNTMNTWWDGYKIDKLNTMNFNMQSPLPITLSYFNATLKNDKVNIKWTTEYEYNNDYFTIQRSNDGKNFDNIRVIGGVPYSNSTIEYSTTDDQPLLGISFYRLKQTDMDGKSSYSQTVVVKNENMVFSLNPNPVYQNGGITLYLDDYVPNELFVSIIKMDGEIVYNYKLFPIGRELQINQNFEPGMYWIYTRARNQVVSKKILIM